MISAMYSISQHQQSGVCTPVTDIKTPHPNIDRASTGLCLHTVLTGSLAFTRAPSTTRGQKAALLLQLFTDRMGGELDQLGYIRWRVGYRFAP